MNRKSFLRSAKEYLISKLYPKPASALTITGAAYGAAKSTIRAIPKYLSKKEIARLRDKNTEYEGRIGILEDYQEKLESALWGIKKRGEEYQGQIDELQEELENLKGALENTGRASGKLETIVKEPPKENIVLISIGLTGLLTSFVLNISKINGFAISENVYFNSIKASIFLFFFSLFLIFIGVKKKKNKILQKNSYKFK